MNDQNLLGRLVYLSVHSDRWLRHRNEVFHVLMANRIARVIKVFDWETAEGKYLLEQREKSGKWADLPSKDFKFVLSIFYPELVRDGKVGITVEEMLPRVYPGEKTTLFELLPDWMGQELSKLKSKDRTFKVVPGKGAKKGKKRVS
jgi:hypothetical protein